MRIVIDACILYPTVMREVVLGAAEATRAFQPLWSARILEEWARAAEKLGPEGTAQARAEIALVRAHWPDAEAAPHPGIEARLWLPDPADVHVLAVAVGSSADAIMTLNARDFPRGTLADEGLVRIDADALMTSLAQEYPEEMAALGARILDEARRLSGDDWTLRSLLKKARLPRLGKELDAV